MTIIVDRYGNDIIFSNESYIPITYEHDIAFLYIDSREACNCSKCSVLKNRRDSIYKNKWYYKIWDQLIGAIRQY